MQIMFRATEVLRASLPLLALVGLAFGLGALSALSALTAWSVPVVLVVASTLVGAFGLGWFRWVPVARSAARILNEEPRSVSILVRDASSTERDVTLGVGMIVLGASGLTVWRFDSTLSTHASGRMIERRSYSELLSARRLSRAAGWAESSVEMIWADGTRWEILLLPPTGLSLWPLSDTYVDNVARLLELTCGLARADDDGVRG